MSGFNLVMYWFISVSEEREAGQRRVTFWGPCFLCGSCNDIVAYLVGRPSRNGWANVCKQCADAAQVIASLSVPY